MSEFSSRVDYLLAEQHLTRADLSRGTDIPPSTIRSWLDHNPSADYVRKVAEFLNVSFSWLMFGEETKDIEFAVNQEEQDLVLNYRQLAPRQKRYIKNVLGVFLHSPDTERESVEFILSALEKKISVANSNEKSPSVADNVAN